MGQMMGRFRIPDVVLGCLLTVAVLAIGMTLGLRTSVGPEPDATGASWLMKDAAGFFTFCLVVVAIVQAWLFLRQLRMMRLAMRDTAEATRAASDAAKAATAQVRLAEAQIEVMKIGIFDLERAFLDVGRFSIVTSFVTHPPPASGFYQHGVDPLEVVAKFSLKNTGRTRAAIIQAHGEFAQGTNPSGEPAYSHLVGTTYRTDFTLSAGVEAEFPYAFKTRVVTEQFFFGYVEYEDIFRRRHTSRFCLRIYPVGENDKPWKWQLAGSDKWREGG
jgi:hypothetical protein